MQYYVKQSSYIAATQCNNCLIVRPQQSEHFLSNTFFCPNSITILSQSQLDYYWCVANPCGTAIIHSYKNIPINFIHYTSPFPVGAIVGIVIGSLFGGLCLICAFCGILCICCYGCTKHSSQRRTQRPSHTTTTSTPVRFHYPTATGVSPYHSQPPHQPGTNPTQLTTYQDSPPPYPAQDKENPPSYPGQAFEMQPVFQYPPYPQAAAYPPGDYPEQTAPYSTQAPHPTCSDAPSPSYHIQPGPSLTDTNQFASSPTNVSFSGSDWPLLDREILHNSQLSIKIMLYLGL